MLSLHKLTAGNAGEIVKYVAESDYYSEEGNVRGVWHGAGCEDFELERGGFVDNTEFKNLLMGFDKNGNQITKKPPAKTHSPGLDMTFSSPKSLSLIRAAASPATQAEIDKIILEARKSALDYATERGFFVIRRGLDGTIKESARPIFALYSHHNSRAHDPQEHYHVIAINAAKDEAGQGYRVEMSDVWRNKMELGAIMRAAEARALQEAGFTIERDGSSYRVKLPGLTKDVEEIFSKGAEKIKQAAGAGASSKSKESAALAVRGDKVAENPADAAIRYRDEIYVASGIDAASIDAARGIEQEITKGAEPRFNLDEIIDEAMNKGAIFRESHLRAAVATAAQGVYNLEEIEQQMRFALGNKRLLRVYSAPEPDKEPRFLGFTTIETASADRELDRFARESAARSTHAIDQSIVEKSISDFERDKAKEIPDFKISDQQRAAIMHLTTGSDFAQVEGVAGAGKSTFLYPVARAYEAAGYKVIGLSFQNTNATDLSHDAKIETYTIDKFVAITKPGAKNGIKIDDKTVILLDEAGQVGGLKLHGVQKIVEESGAKLILSGHTAQKQAITGTAAMKMLRESVGAAWITETQRQRDKEHGEALTKLSEGDAIAALVKHAESGRLHVAAGEGYDEATEAYRRAVDKSGVDKAFILADTNASMRRANDAIREDLREAKVIAKDDYTAQLIDKDRRAVEAKIAIGDRLITRGKVKDEKAIQNGVVWKVTDIDEIEPGRLKIGMERADGAALDESGRKRVEIDTAKTKNFHHAYAMTVDLSQGKTKDAGAILITSGDRAESTQWYVSTSRFRDVPDIIVSTHALDDMSARLDIEMSEDRKIEEIATVLVASAEDQSLKKSHTLDKSIEIRGEIDRDKARDYIDRLEARLSRKVEIEQRLEAVRVSEIEAGRSKSGAGRGRAQQENLGSGKDAMTKKTSSKLEKTQEQIAAQVEALRNVKRKDQSKKTPKKSQKIEKMSLEEMAKKPAKIKVDVKQNQSIADAMLDAEARYRQSLKSSTSSAEIQRAAIERDHARLAYRGTLPRHEQQKFDERVKILDQAIVAPAQSNQLSAQQIAAEQARKEAERAAQRARGLSR